MNTLPKINKKKAFNKSEFKKLAEKVKKTLQQEQSFLDSIRHDKNIDQSRYNYCH